MARGGFTLGWRRLGAWETLGPIVRLVGAALLGGRSVFVLLPGSAGRAGTVASIFAGKKEKKRQN